MPALIGQRSGMWAAKLGRGLQMGWRRCGGGVDGEREEDGRDWEPSLLGLSLLICEGWISSDPT